MRAFILQRIFWMIPTLFAISIVAFTIIQLPPGDFLTTYIAQLQVSGGDVQEDQIAALKKRYGLDQPIYIQYVKWMGGMARGDFGQSFTWNRPVRELIGERLALSAGISILTLVLIFAVAIPIGVYSAVRQYSVGDYALTFLGFIGLAVPEFMVAMILMYVAYLLWGTSVGGLFSDQYAEAAWSLAKFGDLLSHIWIPLLVIGLHGTAGLIRTMRANLLDELRKDYVTTARAKGVPRTRLLFKYPVRVAINPIVSTIGWRLPAIVSGEIIVAVVLNLPTTGPLLLRALLSQDMYLAGTLVMFLAMLTVIGTLISDILLAWVDPRIRFGGRTS
jgi:peptide/nickel transport system permease protein